MIYKKDYGSVPQKLAMGCNKFSISFCHQKYYNHPVYKLLAGTYDGRYFSVERAVFAYISVVCQRYKASNLVVPFVKVTLTQSNSALKSIG